MPSWEVRPPKPGVWPRSVMTGSIPWKGAGTPSCRWYWRRSTRRGWISPPALRSPSRNPLHLAYQAWDLQRFSEGRFLLGIGSQIKAHIEKRFGIDFDPPATRMRDYILALKAIFDCWQNGTRLSYEGKFYRHTLMTPMFNPGPNPFGVPPIMLGALIVHPFNNERFLREQALPAVERGLAQAGRSRADFTLQVNAIVITGEDAAGREAAAAAVRGLLGFYASTPAYLPPMAAIGYAELQPELNTLSKQGQWDELGKRIDDEFVAAFAVSGHPGDIAAALLARYGDCADRLAIYAPYAAPDPMWREILQDLRRLQATA